MRAMIIDPDRSWAGGEAQVLLLAHGLIRRGVEVHLAIDPRGELHARTGGSFPIASVAMRNDLQVIRAPAIARYCVRNRIDLIDAHTAHAHALGFVVKLLLPAIRLVVHRHIDLPPKDTYFNRRLYLSPRVDRFVAISSNVAKVLCAYGVADNRISLQHSTVDPAPLAGLDHDACRTALRSSLGIDPATPLIGVIAQLAPYKDHLMLLDALAMLKRENFRLHCIVAGEGRSRSAVESRISELGLSDSVSMLGFRRDVPELLAGLDLLAMPSRTEGLGIAVLEAFHSGVCVVATDAGGLAEIVIEGETGLSSPAGDADAFAANLKRALIDSRLRNSLAHNARKFAQENYSLDAMIDGNLTLYREVLAN